jgi:hypothetical protein
MNLKSKYEFESSSFRVLKTTSYDELANRTHCESLEVHSRPFADSYTELDSSSLCYLGCTTSSGIIIRREPGEELLIMSNSPVSLGVPRRVEFFALLRFFKGGRSNLDHRGVATYIGQLGRGPPPKSVATPPPLILGIVTISN